MAKQTQVFRSYDEFRRHYFPKAYAKEQEKKRSENESGTGIIEEILREIANCKTRPFEHKRR